MPAPEISIRQSLHSVSGHLQQSSLNTAKTLQAPPSAYACLLQTTGQNVRYRRDGTAPTTTTGFRLRPEDGAVLIPLDMGIQPAKRMLILIEETASAVAEYEWIG